jgi:hypothetical protein
MKTNIGIFISFIMMLAFISYVLLDSDESFNDKDNIAIMIIQSGPLLYFIFNYKNLKNNED